MQDDNVWVRRQHEREQTESLCARQHQLLLSSSPFTMRPELLPSMPPQLCVFLDFDQRINGVFFRKRGCCHKYYGFSHNAKERCRVCALLLQTNTVPALQPFVRSTVLAVQIYYNAAYRDGQDVQVVEEFGTETPAAPVAAVDLYGKEIIVHENVWTTMARFYTALYIYRDFGCKLQHKIQQIVVDPYEDPEKSFRINPCARFSL
jgi:hypothetical protein